MKAVLLTNKIDANVARLLGAYFDTHSEQMECMAAHGCFPVAPDRLLLSGLAIMLVESLQRRQSRSTVARRSRRPVNLIPYCKVTAHRRAERAS